MNIFYVYEWIRLDTNEPFYVGKGKDDRCFELKRNKHFNDVIKYLEKNKHKYVVHILEQNLTEKEALQIESWYINEYICNYGFKLTNKNWGGFGGDIVSLMTNEERKQYSEKMRLSCLGKNKGNFHTQETKLKISKINKGRKRTKEQRLKMSEYLRGEGNPMYGKKHSEETRRKISEANKGKGIGKKHNEETKKLMSEKAKKVKVALEINGNRIEFDSKKECYSYILDTYGLSKTTCKSLFRTGEEFQPYYKKYKKAKGLKLYVLD